MQQNPENNGARLRFTASSAGRLRRLAFSALNAEICGFLLGREETSYVQVDDVLVVRNGDSGWSAFAISDEEASWAQREAARLRLEIVALFHSHSCGSVALSQADLDGVIVSDLTWVVVAPDADKGTVCVGVYGAGAARLVQEIVI